MPGRGPNNWSGDGNKVCVYSGRKVLAQYGYLWISSEASVATNYSFVKYKADYHYH